MSKFDELSRKIDETPAIQLDALVSNVKRLLTDLNPAATDMEVRETLMELMAMSFIAVGQLDALISEAANRRRRMWYVVKGKLKIAPINDSRSWSDWLLAEGDFDAWAVLTGGIVDGGGIKITIGGLETFRQHLKQLALELNLSDETPISIAGKMIGTIHHVDRVG